MLNTLYADLLSRGGERGPLSPKTVRYIHTIIHKALADAVDAGVLSSNIAERAKPPRPNRARAQTIECWEPDELAVFLASVVGARLEPAWRLAAMTGMRRGEILGLRWADVDLDQSRLAVRNAIVSVAYEVLESSPKSHQARVIDLDPATTSLLRRHHEARAQEERRSATSGTTRTSWSARRTARLSTRRALARHLSGRSCAQACESAYTTSATRTRPSQSRPACR